MIETVLGVVAGTLVLLLGLAAVHVLLRNARGWAQRPARALGRGLLACWRNPRQALVDAPVLLQMLALPFLLLFEQVEKRLHPEATRTRQRIFRRNQSAAQLLQKQLDRPALYREGQTITPCRLLSFEVGDHLVRLELEPLAAAGFDTPAQPWSIGINWAYFFHDSQVAVADGQFVRWRLDFDTQRLQRLMDYAATLGADLDKAERYESLNHFFVHGRDRRAQQAHDLAVAEARQALERAMHVQGMDGIWQLAQALGGEVCILSHHLQPDGDGPRLEPTLRGFRLTYAVAPSPWAIDFSEDGLLQWWRSACPETRAVA